MNSRHHHTVEKLLNGRGTSPNGKLPKPSGGAASRGNVAMTVGGAIAWLALLGAMVLFVIAMETQHSKEIESLKRANRQLTTELRHLEVERDDWRKMARR